MYSPRMSVFALSVVMIGFAGIPAPAASDWTCNYEQHDAWPYRPVDAKQTLLLAMQHIQTDASQLLEIHHFVQVFPDMSLGRGGLAAQAVSSAYTTVVMTPERAWILRNGDPEYAINRTHAPTEVMLQRDLSGRCVAAFVNKARYHLAPWAP